MPSQPACPSRLPSYLSSLLPLGQPFVGFSLGNSHSPAFPLLQPSYTISHVPHFIARLSDISGCVWCLLLSTPLGAFPKGIRLCRSEASCIVFAPLRCTQDLPFWSTVFWAFSISVAGRSTTESTSACHLRGHPLHTAWPRYTAFTHPRLDATSPCESHRCGRTVLHFA